MQNEWIEKVELNEQNEIIIILQPTLEAYLLDPTVKSMIQQGAESLLKDNLLNLNIEKNVCKIIVKKGTEKDSLQLVKDELINGLQMAVAFLSQMQNMKNF